MNAWGECLQGAWSEALARPAQERRYRTQRLSPDLVLDIYAGVRANDGALCLVIEGNAPADAYFEVGGMRLAAAADGNRMLLVLSLEDRLRADLFTSICADVVAAAAGAPQGVELTTFLTRLGAWRRFLRDRRTGMSRNEVVGLMGELHVLAALLPRDSDALSLWKSPDEGLQDFDRNGMTLEVKATLGAATGVQISSLDQLDATGLSAITLIHVLLVESPDGETLARLIERVEGLLTSENERRIFQNALLRRGLMPDDAEARRQPVALLRSLDAYNVTEAFPRLTRAAVASAISDARYGIELRGIGGFKTDANSALAKFLGATA